MVSKSLVMEVNSGPATTSNPTLLERPYEGKEKVEKYISNFTKKILSSFTCSPLGQFYLDKNLISFYLIKVFFPE